MFNGIFPPLTKYCLVKIKDKLNKPEPVITEDKNLYYVDPDSSLFTNLNKETASKLVRILNPFDLNDKSDYI